MKERKNLLKSNPEKVFGNSEYETLYNTRDGGAFGTEIDMHNDEPVVLGQATMDSSESESEGEVTEEDRKNYIDSIKKADKFVAIKNKKGHSKS